MTRATAVDKCVWRALGRKYLFTAILQRILNLSLARQVVAQVPHLKRLWINRAQCIYEIGAYVFHIWQQQYVH
jgi:hypothetical protein